MVPNYNKAKRIGLWIWKHHHSLCDGISFVALNLCLDNVYSTDKLIKTNPVPLWRRYLLRAMLPISGFQTLVRTLRTPQDRNVLHDGIRKNLTGRKVTAVSKPINFAEIK